MKKRIVLSIFGILLAFGMPSSAGYHFSETTELMKNSGVVLEANAAEGDGDSSVRKVWVTAYSSTPEETDDTPFTTASMTEVRDGIIAANFLPFGTKVMIPELFGDKIFVVEDRMHKRKVDFVDVWMADKNAALEFGISHTDIVILNEI